MNKKLFFGMFAAASMLFATSCSNDELEVVQSGNETQVSFSLGLEDGIGSRAISDGKSADVLVYAVFDEAGNRISSIAQVKKTGVTFPTTESITLAKGQTYQVAFWAQDNDCLAYTVSDDMKVTVDYQNNNTSNNNEKRDAFFKTVKFTVTGSTSIDVELKRPFAQINVGVYESDWNAAVASGITIENSSVVIKNAATSLNLLDGTVEGSTEVSYRLYTIPNEPLKVDLNGDGTKEDYKWLSMSYILPAAAPTGYEKTTLDNVAFVFAPASGNDIEFKEGLNAVPAQRNWRTNIIGKLLTGDITFNIVIDEEFEDEHNVEVPYASINGEAYKSFAEAMANVQDGETIKLEGETTLEGIANNKLFTIDGKSITIDLNSYGFVANIPDVTANSSIFEVVNGGELTIIGEGNVKFVTKAAPSNVAAFINNIGGTVNLKGGNWTLSEVGGYAQIPTFVDNNSNTSNVTLNIYDGTYTFNRNLFRNFANAAGHNNYATVATINIYGGTFNGRESDPGAIWNQKPNSDVNVPATAGVINVMGGTFNNVEIDDDFASVDYITVTTAEELTAAIAAATTDVTIFFGNDITGNATAEQKEGVNVIINGNAHKYDGTITIDGNARFDKSETLTFTNINFEHTNGSIDFISCNVGGGDNGYAHNVTVKDCTFKGNSNGDVVGMRYRQCYNMSVVNCTATDVHSLLWSTGGQNITVDGVNVTAKEGGLSTNTTSNITIKNSTITVPTAYGYGVRLNSSDDNQDLSLNVENCTITAEAPILLRQAKAKNYTIALSGTNTLNTDKEYQIIPTASDYKEGTELTYTTAHVTITGAEGFSIFSPVGQIVEIGSDGNQVKGIIFSAYEDGTVKAVSVEEFNMSGKTWQQAMDWAEKNEGWHLATIDELDAIHKARFLLNDVLEADNAGNTLFEEDEYYDAANHKYAIYISSTDAEGTDPKGNGYFPNRVHVKYFNTNGYWDYDRSTSSTINKSAPFRDGNFARAVYEF